MLLIVCRNVSCSDLISSILLSISLSDDSYFLFGAVFILFCFSSIIAKWLFNDFILSLLTFLLPTTFLFTASQTLTISSSFTLESLINGRHQINARPGIVVKNN